MVYWHGVGLSGNSHARLCGCLSAVNINKMSADHWLTHLTGLPKKFFSQPRLSTLKKQLLHLWRQSLIQLLYMITAALTQSQMQQSSCFMWHIKRLALSLTVFISNESWVHVFWHYGPPHSDLSGETESNCHNKAQPSFGCWRWKLAPRLWVCLHLAAPHLQSGKPDGVSTSSVDQAELDPKALLESRWSPPVPNLATSS